MLQIAFCDFARAVLDLLFPNLARGGFCQISDGKSGLCWIFTVDAT